VVLSEPEDDAETTVERTVIARGDGRETAVYRGSYRFDRLDGTAGSREGCDREEQGDAADSDGHQRDTEVLDGHPVGGVDDGSH